MELKKNKNNKNILSVDLRFNSLEDNILLRLTIHDKLMTRLYFDFIYRKEDIDHIKTLFSIALCPIILKTIDMEVERIDTVDQFEHLMSPRKKSRT